MRKNDNIIPMKTFHVGTGTDSYTARWIKAETLDQAIEIYATTELEPYTHVGRRSSGNWKALNPKGYLKDGSVDPEYKTTKECEDLEDYKVIQFRDAKTKELLKEVPVFELFKFDMWDNRNIKASKRPMLTGMAPAEGEVMHTNSLSKHEMSSAAVVSSRKYDLMAQMKKLDLQKRKLEDESRALNTVIEERAERLGLMHLYMGVNNQIVQIRAGKNAPDETKIHIFESIKYMNEEVGILEDFQDIDFSNLSIFDDWVADHYHELLPLPKCIQIMRVRRNKSSRYKIEPFQTDPNEFNFEYYFLFRNGGNVFRVFGDIPIPEGIFPTDNFYSKFYGFDGDFKESLIEQARDILYNSAKIRNFNTEFNIDIQGEPKIRNQDNYSDAVITGTGEVTPDEIQRVLITNFNKEGKSYIDLNIIETETNEKELGLYIKDYSYAKITFGFIVYQSTKVNYDIRYGKNTSTFENRFNRYRQYIKTYREATNEDINSFFTELLPEKVSRMFKVDIKAQELTVDPGALLHLNPDDIGYEEVGRVVNYRTKWLNDNNVDITVDNPAWNKPLSKYYHDTRNSVMKLQERVKSYRKCINAVSTPKAESIFAVERLFLKNLFSHTIEDRCYDRHYIPKEDAQGHTNKGWILLEHDANDHWSKYRKTKQAYEYVIMALPTATLEDVKSDILADEFDKVMNEVKKDQYQSFKALLVLQNVLDYTRIFGGMEGKVNLFVPDERFHKHITRLNDQTLAIADTAEGRIPFETYIAELMNRPLKKWQKVFVINNEKTDVWHIEGFDRPTDYDDSYDDSELHTNTGAVYMVKAGFRSNNIVTVTGDFGVRETYDWKIIPNGRSRKYERNMIVPFDIINDLDRIRDYIKLRSFRDKYFSTWYGLFVSIIRYAHRHNDQYDFSWFEKIENK